LEDFNIIVGTPNCVSPGIPGVISPPAGLIDLLLIDEAHHSAARTWNELIGAFPGAKCVLFTATPFRQDKREINGRIVYDYSIKQAFADNIFGKVQFVPVHQASGVKEDEIIAKKAEQVFREDTAAGFKHLLFVRTDSKTRSEELDDLYKACTGLNLRLIHSGHSSRHIRRTIRDLRAGDLDGIICVNMLGEGFDLPNLKIAAIHSPHRTLGVTLQFVGRFARTNSPDIGSAKFIAVPSEIKIETQKLYQEGAVWQEIILGLGEERVRREIDLREKLDSFVTAQDETSEGEDISLYALTPYKHVKIYRIDGTVNIDAVIELDDPFSMVHREVSRDLNTSVFITKEVRHPRWARTDLFSRTEYDIFVVTYHTETNLLFICSSRRSDVLYDKIAVGFTSGGFRRLPLSHLNRVLRNLKDIGFYNIGMRNRIKASRTESYRIVTGSAVDKSIKATDGRLYHQGHCFGSAKQGDEDITIGLSSGSKVWSNGSMQIPELVSWVTQLAGKISDISEVRTQSNFDHLPSDEEVSTIPGDIICLDWNEDTYNTPPILRIKDQARGEVSHQLLDVNMVIDRERSTRDGLIFAIDGDAANMSVRFSPRTEPFFSWSMTEPPETIVESDEEPCDLMEYLNAKGLSLYLDDFSRLDGNRIIRFKASQSTLDIDQIEVVDWEGNSVDVTKEFGDSSGGLISIQAYLKEMLVGSSSEFVFFDHGTGEVADFVVICQGERKVTYSFYHCKASVQRQPGNRVGDVYEVCGQVVKSTGWLMDPKNLLSKIKRRMERGSLFIKGDYSALNRIIDTSKGFAHEYEIVLVQPGVSKSRINAQIKTILAAASDYSSSSSGCRLRIFASA